ncbi:uncharacterized protein DAT39_009784, partial [Clarias magur]
VLHYKLFTHWQTAQHPLGFSKSTLHSSLTDITTLLYVLYVLCLDSINAAQLSVTAAVGSTVVLPCEWRDLSVQTPHVVWTMEQEVVFERKGKDSFQAEGYEGRVDVPEDELNKGNCSLVLKNVRVTDEAEYRSSMLVENPKKSVLVQEVQLSVYNGTDKSPDKTPDSPGGTEVSPDSSGLISPSLLQIISADLRSVDPGENITLLCNITQCSEISWYQMNSAGVREIISARQGRLYKRFYPDYNVDESHFDVTESNSSVGLVIIGVGETDLGFYYCGGQNKTHTQFGKPIRLDFTTGVKR